MSNMIFNLTAITFAYRLIIHFTFLLCSMKLIVIIIALTFYSL